MKTSDLILKLQILLEKHGDKDLRFTAKDNFSKFGDDISLDLRVGETTGFPTDWSGCFTNGNQTTIQFSIDAKDGKKSKLTFRK